MSRRTYQVKDVVRMAGVSVRALHHYDEIGLLTPSARTDAGYRVYDDDDLLRLQQILIGRELGLALEQIRRSLDDAGFDRRTALVAQRRELEKRATKTAEMLRSVDRAIAVIDGTTTGEPMDMKKIFDGFDPETHEAEARARWGESDSFQVSMERTKGYTEDDWRKLKAEQAAIYDDAFKAMNAGLQPDADDVVEIAERHRRSIDTWFYPCSPQRHVGLADMYEADPRFAANIDKHGEGLTPFLAAAIRANAKKRR